MTHTSLAGLDSLVDIETEADNVPNCPGKSASNAQIGRPGAVLDHLDVAIIGNGDNLVHTRGKAKLMDDKNRFHSG